MPFEHDAAPVEDRATRTLPSGMAAEDRPEPGGASSAPWARVAVALLLMPSLALAPVALAPSALAAQQRVTAAPQFEARLDAVLSPAGGAMLGLGVNVRAGWYTRLGLALSAGAVHAAGELRDTERLDATARFLFDPFAEGRRAFYAGAGLGARRSASGEVEGLLLGVVGAEGPSAGRIVPSVELTLGGGVRLGVALRSRRPQGR